MTGLAVILLILIPVLIILGAVGFFRTLRLQREQIRFQSAVIAKLRNLERRIDEAFEDVASSDKDATNATPAETQPEEADDSGEPDTGDQPIVEHIDSDDEDTSDDDEANEQETEPEPAIAARAAPWGTTSAQVKKTGTDMEALVGGRWSVLLGGLALALGLVFLVKYSIEAGLLGPGIRILLGLLFSASFFAAGEWLRRSDRDFALPVYAKADVPGTLTGAGAIGAFATLYAAHALYGFIGPGFAFIALTLIGIATMALSAVHGPKLAAIGVLGAYATPLLVSSSSPNHLALTIHVLVVTAVVVSLAHIRNWAWLAIAGIVASCLWIVLSVLGDGNYAGIAGAILVVGIALIFATLFWLREEASTTDRSAEWTAILAFGLFTIGYLFQLSANNDLPASATAITTSLIIVFISAWRTSVAPAALFASVLTTLTIAASDLQFNIVDGLTQTSDIAGALVPIDTFAFIQNTFLVAVPAAALAFWGTRKTARDAPRASGWLASSVNAIAFASLVVAYLRVAPFETRPTFGAAGVAIAALLAVATEYFIRQKPDDNTAPAPAAFAVGAIACASFAIAVSVDVGWMPLAFALTACGIAAVYIKRPVATLPWLALVSTGLAGLTLFVNMPLELPDVSETLILNGLIPLVAVPAAALLLGGEILRKANAVKLTEAGLTASGLALAALFVGLEIIHIINNGDLDNSRQSLAETAGHTLAAMGFAIGLQRIANRSGVSIYDRASQIAGFISVAFAILGLLIVFNPAFTNEPVGTGIVFNLLLPGYLLTGLSAAVVALLARPVRPRWYTLIYAGLAGGLLFTYFSLMLRKTFQGELLGISRSTGDLEFWLYSPLWLVMGAILLAIGLRFKSLPIRTASGILIALTIVKVFLLDMSALTGVLRAFSFIGLGLSLIVIGRFYQRILTKQAKSDTENKQPSEED